MPTTSGQFLLDKQEDDDSVDDESDEEDESSSISDEEQNLESGESKDKLNKSKENKDEFKVDSKIKSENQKLKRNTEPKYKQPNKNDLENSFNASSYLTASHDSKSNKSEFSLINQINNKFSKLNSSNQLSNQLDKQNKIQSNKLLLYYNRRLKTRHVASGDQLRILRREGQSLRLSCLPAFHAPSRSTVNWFKNGDLIKVSCFLVSKKN